MSEKHKKVKKEEPPEPEAVAPEENASAAAPEGQSVPAAPEEEPLREQFLRLRADFDNFRKRTQRERGELFQLANETVFAEILPVLDHFEMGLKSAEEHQTDCAVTEGFRLVYNQLLDVLKKFNVTIIPAVGEAFNPHRHEALMHRHSDKPSETVIEQVRRGYLLGEKLLRAAQVIVSSGPQEESADEEQQGS